MGSYTLTSSNIQLNFGDQKFDLRWNDQCGRIEVFDGTQWLTLATFEELIALAGPKVELAETEKRDRFQLIEEELDGREPKQEMAPNRDRLVKELIEAKRMAMPTLYDGGWYTFNADMQQFQHMPISGFSAGTVMSFNSAGQLVPAEAGQEVYGIAVDPQGGYWTEGTGIDDCYYVPPQE